MRWSWDRHPQTSDQFGAALLDRVGMLATFPYLGARAPNGSRRILSGPIRIYYRVDEERKTIEVLRFLHASRADPLT